jgi:hypothetical protein
MTALPSSSMNLSSEAFATCLQMLAGGAGNLEDAIAKLGVEDPVTVTEHVSAHYGVDPNSPSQSVLGGLDPQSQAACAQLSAARLVRSL